MAGALKTAKFIHVGNNGSASSIKAHSGWQKIWFNAAAGNFRGQAFSDLLLYDRIHGQAKLLSTDGNGNYSLVKHHKNWSKSWDLVITGRFDSSSSREAILYYSRSTGTAVFFRFEDNGSYKEIKKHSGWRKTWDIIVPFKTPGAATGLLFYDRTAGEGKLYSTDGNGNISLIRHYRNWKKTWDIIVTGEFGGNNATSDVLFYRRVVGERKIFSSSNSGVLTLQSHSKKSGKWWDMIVPLNVAGARTKLLFYRRATGNAVTYRTKDYNINFIKSAYDWRKTWVFMVPGRFKSGAGYGLFLYEHGVRLKIRAFRCADDDGSRKTDISVNQINKWIDLANEIYSKVGIQLERIQVLSVLNNTLINSLGAVSGLEDGSPLKVQRLKYKKEAQKLAKEEIGKIVVYFRFGDGETSTGQGFSGAKSDYIAMTAFDAAKTRAYHQDGSDEKIQSLKLFAHELGHYLGLSHTHVKVDYKDARSAHAAVLNYLNKKGSTSAEALDNDKNTVSDTPPDVGKKYYLLNEWNPADLSREIVIRSADKGINIVFNTDRHNVMSYYNCDYFYRLTHDQYHQIYKTLRQKNRKHLFS